jgi:hypothetical protein
MMTPSSQSRANPLLSNNPAAEPALAVETERLRQQIRGQRPDEIALLAGAVYTAQNADGGTLSLDLWGEAVVFNFPELVARRENFGQLPLPFQALLMYYLSTTDGFSPAGEWVSFADLPGGRMYAQAFQGYSGNVLVRTFGEDLDAFRRAYLTAGGRLVELGDAAFAFTGLPNVPLLVTYWQGEDEFPSTSKVLFDRTATHHLPIDVCAILGSMLVSRILHAHVANNNAGNQDGTIEKSAHC